MPRISKRYVPIFQKDMYVIENTKGELLAILPHASDRDEAEETFDALQLKISEQA
ncbi:hypothetical protein ACQVTS_29550 [Bacillus mycoides]|uniref:hypothetical protein n=1 Tax=Bacillus mycoides TaxID=1405 RepID=UPI003D65895B